MSRHRNVRKLNIDEELDDDISCSDDYSSDEEQSPEISRFIYKRDEAHQNEREHSMYPQKAPVTNISVGNKSIEKLNTSAVGTSARSKIEQLKITNKSESRNMPILKTSPKTLSKSSNLQTSLSSTPSNKFNERTVEPPINLILVGHVDAGKSTLLGHFLYLLGAVDNKTLHRHKQESSSSGKGSFAFAWILDETSEERERGVTMDVGMASFAIKNKKFNFLDSPGHKDFIPNMINGASKADAAILIVNAVKGEFETGFDLGGQTREHLCLLRALGISNIIVAINKMDSVNWLQERFDEIHNILSTYLRRIGIEKFYFIPVSGLKGINLINLPESSHPLLKWYKGKCLVDVLDLLPIPMNLDDKPLRIVIDNVSKCSNAVLNVAAKIISGFVEVGDKLFLMPDAIPVVVKTIILNDSPIKGACFAGDQVQMSLNGQFEPDSILSGSVLCKGNSELVPVTNRFYAKIATFDLKVPIMPGSQSELFVHSLRLPCTITALESIIEKTSKSTVKHKPRILPKNSAASVEISTELNICIETFSKNKSMGRIALRLNGHTIAAGIIEKVEASI